jgi:hypothetical protein
MSTVENNSSKYFSQGDWEIKEVLLYFVPTFSVAISSTTEIKTEVNQIIVVEN